MRTTIHIVLAHLLTTAPSLVRSQPVAADPLGELSGVALSLLIVVCIILAAAWVARRTPFAPAGRKSGPLKLLATLPLGPKERLLLVEADGCEVLIGVSPAGIFPLHRSVHDERAIHGSSTEPRADVLRALHEPGELLGGAP